ncbi:MAG: hypothetical protein ISS94_01645 [Candidatus Syntrophoarchaeum sp.]|nr:hypothetical protein [Methanomicrobia archaeon]MBL7117475.1 hypothetical protein [Candidatus Syntrophoarchaeum sp.]
MSVSEEKEYEGFVKEAKKITRCAMCGKETDNPKIFGRKFYCDDCYYIDVEMVGDGVGI